MTREWLARRPWARVALGMVLGLYLGRMAAEGSSAAWRMAALLPLVLSFLALGVAIVLVAMRRVQHIWPLWLLAAYVVWPLSDSGVRGWFALFVGLALLLANSPTQPSTLGSLVANTWLKPGVGLLVFASALSLYVATLAPGVLPADAGEFQTVCATLGLAHPPGYALYTLLGRLLTLLPLGSLAWRVNLFAAVCGAATVAILAQSLWRSSGSVASGVLAACILGLSTTFWAQSTTANVRSLTALLTALCLVIALHWESTRSRGGLLALALVLGLGIGHHSSLVPVGLAFAVYVYLCDPSLGRQPRRWIAPLLGLVLALGVLAYLPIRNAFLPPGEKQPIGSLVALIDYVSAQGFRGDMLYFRRLPELLARANVWLDILRLQFGWPLLVATALSAIVIAKEDARTLVLLVGVFLVNSLLAVTYRAPQTVEYLIPSYVALALLLGRGARAVLTRPNRRAWAAPLVAGCLVAAIANGARNWPSFRDLHRDDSTRTYAETILTSVPQNGLILANWHRATPFWYLQRVEGLRTDVDVVYVFPEGATPNEEVWLRRVTENITARPVVVTNRYFAYERSPYRFVPFNGAWLVVQDVPTSIPEPIIGREARFEPGIRVLGYQLSASELSPGTGLGVRVVWQPEVTLERDYVAFVQIIFPDGVVGQGDTAHRSREYQAGEVVVDAYDVPLLMQAPPGEYRLVTGFYFLREGKWERLTSGGRDSLELGTVRVKPMAEPPVTLHPLAHAWANGLELIGVDYDRSIRGQLRLYLHWRRRATWLPNWVTVALAVGEPARMTISAAGTPLAMVGLPRLGAGESATVVVDLPGEVSALTVALSTASGVPVSRLGPWHRPSTAAVTLGTPTQTALYIPLGGMVALVGLSTCPGPDGQRWLIPQFLALRPLSADYSVSVGLSGPDGSKSDSTPALGAVPTLKWVRGWRVRDPHLLTESSQARAITLTMYDAFTLQPLVVLDERRVRQGQGTYLELEPPPYQ